MNVAPAMAYDAAEGFAGPGGWGEGARMLGLHTLGFERDAAACMTAKAAGHERVRADVAAYPARSLRGIPGHITSPPCTLFSKAGKGTGRQALAILADGIHQTFRGHDVREQVRTDIYATITLPARTAENDRRTAEKQWTAEKVEQAARTDAFIASLVLEPARWILEQDPEWVAMTGTCSGGRS